MAKMARERAVKERRERKAEKKRARKLGASAEAAPEPGDADAQPVEAEDARDESPV